MMQHFGRAGRAMAALIACLLFLPFFASAQTYPSRPIVVIVPFAAGGPTDTVMRLVAEAMTKDLGQPVIVENVGGAGGTLGAGRAAKAAPDGHTLLFHNIGMAASVALYRSLPYDPLAAFDYIGLITEVPMTVVGRLGLEAKDLPALIALIKANGAKMTQAHAGIGSAAHLCGILFKAAIQSPMVSVPYKGTGPAMTDLLGGQVDLMCDQTTNTTNQIKAGKIQAYATTSAQRLAALPDVATAAEQGLTSFQVGVWHGLYAPKGTPQDARDKLTAALRKALKDPAVVTRFADLGTAPVHEDQVSAVALETKLTSEIARWSPIIKAAGEFAD